MCKISYFTCLILLFLLVPFAHSEGLGDDTLVVRALSAINLAPENFSISPDVEPPDPFRNPIITELLRHSDRLEPVTEKLGDSITKVIRTIPNLYHDSIPLTWDQINIRAKQIRDKEWKGWTTEERKHLLDNLTTIYQESDDVADLDIFTLKEREEAGSDSLRALIKDIKKMHDYQEWTGLLHQLRSFAEQFTDSTDWESIFGPLRHTPLKGVAGSIVGWAQTNGGTIVIGGTGRNIYEGDFAAIIDLGGDDEYRGRFAGTNDSIPVGLVVDFHGNDMYVTDSSFSSGGALDGVALLLDKEGNDHYIGQQWTQGAALCGASMLDDRAGFDVYDADGSSQGCAGWGFAALHDSGGNDLYRVHIYGQGVGLVAGWGVLLDEEGDDQYLATPRYTDVLRYQDHSVTLSQGFGYGLRPYLSGGFGFLIDEKGGDFYSCDIFGQGASYWYSLGALLDHEGNDHYQAYQYAEGAGIHISLGILIDYTGNDHYDSKGVSQGCGHDLGTGLLHDKDGDDTYLCSELSQGAGSANGYGILLDDGGSDIFGNRNSGMVMGYGNPRREYGSIGLFLKKGGDNRYADTDAGNGRMWLRGVRGVGWDVKLPAKTEKKP